MMWKISAIAVAVSLTALFLVVVGQSEHKFRQSEMRLAFNCGWVLARLDAGQTLPSDDEKQAKEICGPYEVMSK